MFLDRVNNRMYTAEKKTYIDFYVILHQICNTVELKLTLEGHILENMSITMDKMTQTL